MVHTAIYIDKQINVGIDKHGTLLTCGYQKSHELYDIRNMFDVSTNMVANIRMNVVKALATEVCVSNDTPEYPYISRILIH